MVSHRVFPADWSELAFLVETLQNLRKPDIDFNDANNCRLKIGHLACAIAHVASLPLDTSVQFMTIMATKMPFVGRG